MSRFSISLVMGVFFLSGATAAHASCGSAFCNLNTQWDTQGTWTDPGLRLDVRGEYIDQDQPRAGRENVAVGQIPQHHDEVRSLNRNWIAALDYAGSGPWGYTLMIPYVDRNHVHIHNHHGAALIEEWNFTELGDVRALARYQVANDPEVGKTGLVLGAKLPTGDTKVTNSDGEVAERSLQPGTGTTDVIFGVYNNRPLQLGKYNTTAFTQTQVQVPLYQHDHYRIGTVYTADAGISLPLSSGLSALLQANATIKSRDKGTEAEPENSGGSFVWLSPGLSYAASKDVRVYGFVQLPLYQRVNGVQLVADQTFAVGVSARF